jgi:hypothetical protein
MEVRRGWFSKLWMDVSGEEFKVIKVSEKGLGDGNVPCV